MRKITSSVFLLAFSVSAVFAQERETLNQGTSERTMADPTSVKLKTKMTERNHAETPIWSEDFANGIPSTWINTASDTNGVWEYRGPMTTPPSAQGSIGAYSGVNNTPPTNDPIASPTGANGFVIFDSDYLDNGGTPGNFGNGQSAAPHFATLTTETIDLTGNPNVELTFYQYYRRFAGPSGSQEVPGTYLSFSNDGGLTWGNRLPLNREIFVNNATAEDDMLSFNVSDYIGGSANAKIRFEFDGDYYFWMIDDIELNVAPENELRFTRWYGGDAPAYDMFDTAYYGKDGIECLNFATDTRKGNIWFDANIVNYGSMAQTNVKLQVDILDGNNTLVQSISSPAKASVASGDTLTVNDLVTSSTPWTAPASVQDYQVVFRVMSDSTEVRDTVSYSVDPEYQSFDRGTFFNSWGNGNRALAVGNRVRFDDYVEVNEVRVLLASTTEENATVEIYICENDGFDNTSNPPSTVLGGTTSPVAITASDISNGFIDIDVTDGTNGLVQLPSDVYYVIVSFAGLSTAGPRVSLLNDVSIDQPGGVSIYYSSTQNQWFGGNQGSNVCNAIAIRPRFTSSHINVAEETLEASVKVTPNPATDFVNVNFTDVDGEFEVALMDITGRLMSNETVEVLGATKHRIDVSSMPAGVYMLNVNNGKASVSYKITVQ